MIDMAHHLGEEQLIQALLVAGDPVGRPGCDEHSDRRLIGHGVRTARATDALCLGRSVLLSRFGGNTTTVSASDYVSTFRLGRWRCWLPSALCSLFA